ncbi:MAG: hypothetical protein U0175_08015 [Caldilineaceae bacterium]
MLTFIAVLLLLFTFAYEGHGIAIKQGGWDKVKQIVPGERLLWSSEFAYAVGLIASDGNLQSNSNEVRLASLIAKLLIIIAVV